MAELAADFRGRPYEKSNYLHLDLLTTAGMEIRGPEVRISLTLLANKGTKIWQVISERLKRGGVYFVLSRMAG